MFIPPIKMLMTGDGFLLYPGWWYTNPSEKYEFVSWDDEIPNLNQLNGTMKFMFQTTNQYPGHIP